MLKIYSKDEKEKVLNLYSNGVSVTQISKGYGIARSTIYSWLNDSKNNKLLNRKINMRDVFDLKQKYEQQEYLMTQERKQNILNQQ
jgi:transposase-like protein